MDARGHNAARVDRDGLRRWLLFALRWGIAVLGIGYVLWNLNLRDHVLVLDEASEVPVVATVVGTPPEDTWPLTVVLPDGRERTVTRAEVLIRPDRRFVELAESGSRVAVLALDVAPGATVPRRVLVAESRSGPGRWVEVAELKGGYTELVAFPAREIGLIRMVREAETLYLVLAVGVIPVIYLITGYRWWLLLRGLEVPLTPGRAIQINLVGAFYNTFMPGQTGGDLLKAYYAAKSARDHRTRAVLSVIIDRAIGLLALIMLGGACAALQWQVPQCRQVAVAAALILTSVAAGLVLVGSGRVRGALGVEWVLGKLPMQEKVVKVWGAMSLYKRRPMLMLGTLLLSFPVHGTIVVSAMFAGWAFALPLEWTYYWVLVPTVVLAGALPISPQGAGVMEFFAILLTRPQGATVGQAFALTMSIRLVQIVWNLLAGVIVLAGGYHAPTATEQADLERGSEPVEPLTEAAPSSGGPVRES